MRTMRTRPLMSATPISGPVVYGSNQPRRFLSDLASGSDSLDVVIIGDSNTGSALQDMWGYHAGFSQTFMERGYVCYGTPVLPVMLDGADRGMVSWRFVNNTFAPTGSLLSGNASGGATAYSVWTPGTDFVRYGTTTSSPISRDSWAYISTSTQYFQQFGLSLAQSHPLNAAGTRYYRVRSGTFASGSGGYCARVNFDGTGAPSPVIATRVASNTGNAYGFVANDVAFTTNGVYTPRGAWSSVDSGSGITNGPLAIHSHSMYARRKGWSVTAHGYLAGYTSTQIASVISGAGSTLLQTHLQELRERQILGGGTGRVLLVVHSGMNGNDTVATWQDAHLSIWNTYKAAWVALGYPLSDLAIVSFCSHVPSATDTAPSGTTGNLAAIRAASGAFASANPDMTIMDVSKLLSFDQLVSGVGLIPGPGPQPNFPTQRSYYQRYNNLPNAGSNIVVHLSGGFYVSQTTFDTSDGYTTLSNLMVTALLSA